MSIKVFVYGTLRTGDCRHGVKSFIQMIAPEAYLKGFKMLDLGGFPGLVRPIERREEYTIRGEVHEYEDFYTLDRIEGYQDESPSGGLYDRQQVIIDTPDGEIEGCWVYTYNERIRSEHHERPPTIESGDWFEHRGYYEQLEGVERSS